MKVIIDDKIPFIKGALEPYADVKYMAGNIITNETLKDTDALIIRTRTKCNATLLENTKVKFIASATIGYDHIDTEYCNKNEIKWINAPGCNSGSVMQYVASAILHYAYQKNISLKDRVIGVVGIGNVGKKIVRLAEIFGMQVLLNDPPRARKEGNCGFISLDGILREADIISFHVPLILEGEDKTYHLADKIFFDKINPGTLFINTSRGEVVDTVALKKVLTEDKLSGVILDVWENEPGIDIDLLQKLLIGTPHIAGYSADGKANGTKMVVQEFSNYYGLGLDDWEPEDIPPADDSVIFYDGKNKTFQEIISELILHTYPIQDEKEWLLQDPTKFEDYRGNYPLRREFSAYTVKVTNISEEDKNKIRRLGFYIEE